MKLSKEALKLNPNLKSITQDMEALTEYAVSYRYPDASKSKLEKTDVKVAIARAEAVYNELLNYLDNVSVP